MYSIPPNPVYVTSVPCKTCKTWIHICPYLSMARGILRDNLCNVLLILRTSFADSVHRFRRCSLVAQLTNVWSVYIQIFKTFVCFE